MLGRVALWGRVIEHEYGYRAQYAYPQRLRLIRQFCFWMSDMRRSTPGHVGWFPHRRADPPVRGAPDGRSTQRRVTAIVLPASEVVQRLRDAYAVDPLAV